jgi:hypothetical protein
VVLEQVELLELVDRAHQFLLAEEYIAVLNDILDNVVANRRFWHSLGTLIEVEGLT